MKRIIEKSYQLFSKYKAVRPLDVCTQGCCMDIEEEGLLASLPVGEIPKDLLRIYNDGASTAKTPVEEIKHFLPRFIELVSAFDFPTHSAEIAFRRLSPFDKSEWTDEELNFLSIFSLEYFKHCLKTYPLPDNERIDSIIIMLWRGQFDVDSLLSSWQTDSEIESTLHFKDLFFEGFDQFNRHKLTNAFGDKEIADKLKKWIHNKEIIQNFTSGIEKIILNDSVKIEETYIEELNLLYEILKNTGNAK